MRYRHLRRALQHGAVIAYPTESCFGLGCDPFHYPAVRKILRLKKRPMHKGLILVASSLKQLQPFIAPLSTEQQQRLEHSWPGHHTWLIPASIRCPSWLTGRHHSIACRISAHPIVQQLCHSTGMALVSTSANRSHQQSARTSREATRRFAANARIIFGKIGGQRRPSTIQHLLTLSIKRS